MIDTSQNASTEERIPDTSPIDNTQPSILRNTPDVSKFIPILLWLISIVIVFIISFSLGRYIKEKLDGNIPDTIHPTPTIGIQITPNSGRKIHPAATMSAYLDLKSVHASLSSSIERFNARDPMVVPPVIDMSVDFSNE